MLKALAVLYVEQSTDIPLTFLLHGVSERNGKKKTKKKTGFVLWLPVTTCPPIWLGHFSDLGSVNITQKKKKSFPSFYAKVERFNQRHQALPITLQVCREAVEQGADACWGWGVVKSAGGIPPPPPPRPAWLSPSSGLHQTCSKDRRPARDFNLFWGIVLG